jgi:hypothetical protein
MPVRHALLLALVWPGPAALAESRFFAGALGGISTLSADGRSEVAAGSASLSLYKPENGATIHAFGGIHLSEHLSVQGNYVWSRNALTLTSSTTSAGGLDAYEQSRSSRQDGVSGDLLLYFRNRASWARPYLSAGAGVTRFSTRSRRLLTVTGAPALPPARLTSTEPVLRVAVGIDLGLRRGWAFRYSFCESIRTNPVSALLLPPGRRNLATFQNLFGFVKTF